MEFIVKQISSLEKILKTSKNNHCEITKKTLLAGERFSYQICIKSDAKFVTRASVESDISDCVKLYSVKDVVVDAPFTLDVPTEDDYIIRTPGSVPDLLIPLEESDCKIPVDRYVSTIWVKVCTPNDITPGIHRIKIKFELPKNFEDTPDEICCEMELNVLPSAIPEQKLIYTRWFYADCIADVHNVDIFSEEHWNLIDKYISAAADVGINMILVPTHTPPLDTAVGTTRPCVQLVDIEKNGDNYTFSFEKFRRFISICKKHGIKYYEIAHMFSQWGANYAPNIMVTENGKNDYLFGWHVAADSELYSSFLKQYVAAIISELEKEGIAENTYFHVSDEPNLNTTDTYKTAVNMLRPLIKGNNSFDALSNYFFYENGLVECPVTCIDHIHEFLQHNIPNQWLYCCCIPQTVYPNQFIAMPSYRNRILGFLMYKYNIKGFLQWGFNYYNASCSSYKINPYLTTSGDKAYPSGDPFIVYPGKNTVYPSIRGEVTFEAIQDTDICFALEKIIGRDKVVKMIDEAAERDLRFDDYPKNKEFIENLRAQMIEKISSSVK